MKTNIHKDNSVPKELISTVSSNNLFFKFEYLVRFT